MYVEEGNWNKSHVGNSANEPTRDQLQNGCERLRETAETNTPASTLRTSNTNSGTMSPERTFERSGTIKAKCDMCTLRQLNEFVTGSSATVDINTMKENIERLKNKAHDYDYLLETVQTQSENIEIAINKSQQLNQLHMSSEVHTEVARSNTDHDVSFITAGISRLIEENNKLCEKLKEAWETISAMSDAKKSMSEQLIMVETERVKLTKKLKSATATALAALQLVNDSELTTESEQLTEANTELATKSKDLEDVNTELAIKSKELEDVNTELATKSKDLEDINTELATKSKELEDVNSELAAVYTNTDYDIQEAYFVDSDEEPLVSTENNPANSLNEVDENRDLKEIEHDSSVSSSIHQDILTIDPGANNSSVIGTARKRKCSSVSTPPRSRNVKRPKAILIEVPNTYNRCKCGSELIFNTREEFCAHLKADPSNKKHRLYCRECASLSRSQRSLKMHKDRPLRCAKKKKMELPKYQFLYKCPMPGCDAKSYTVPSTYRTHYDEKHMINVSEVSKSFK